MKASRRLTTFVAVVFAAACSATPEVITLPGPKAVATAAPPSSVAESPSSLRAPIASRAPTRNPDGTNGVKTVDPPVDVPGRRHKASSRALELIRRADGVTYRPTDHGLRVLRCDVEMTMTMIGLGKSVYRATYVIDAPGHSTLTLVSESTDAQIGVPWDVGASRFAPSARCKATLDDMFDGPRLERLVDAYELEMREEDGKQFVLAVRAAGEGAEQDFIDLRFGPDGTLVQDGPGDVGVHPFCSSRRVLTYDRQGEQFRLRGGRLFDDGHGFEQFKYDTIAGIVLPVKHTIADSGLIEQVAVSNVQVNPPDLARWSGRYAMMRRP